MSTRCPTAATLACLALCVAVPAGPAPAQSFSTCRITTPGAYLTEVTVQRGLPCTIELRSMGITSAQIMTPPNNGQAELRGPNPVIVYTARPTYVGTDRFTARVSGPELRTGLWTFRVTAR